MNKKAKDSGGDERPKWFAVNPNPNCPHIASSSFKLHKKLQIHSSGSEGKSPRTNTFEENCACQQCGDTDETWVCLYCSFSGCSRYKAAHMVSHVSDEFHDHTKSVIAISMADLSVWCFICDEYITHPKLQPILREFHLGKFGKAPSSQLYEGAGPNTGSSAKDPKK